MTAGERARNRALEWNPTNRRDVLWFARATEVMEYLIGSKRSFSANDFQYLMHGMTPNHGSVVGAFFSRYARRGDIVRVGITRATKESSHARLYPLWIAKGATYSDPELIPVFKDSLKRINESIDRAQAAPVTVFPRGYVEGLEAARQIVNEEINRKR